MVKEKLAFTNPKKASAPNTKKPQPKQQQVGHPKVPSSLNGDENISAQLPSSQHQPPILAEPPVITLKSNDTIGEEPNNELINRINKEIRNYRKQIAKHKKLGDDIQNQLDFEVVLPTIPASLNKKELSFDESIERKKIDTQIEEVKKKEKQLKEMIEILESESKSLDTLEFIQGSMSKVFNDYETRQSKLEKDVKQLQKEIKQKDQQLEEALQALNTTKYQLSIQANSKKENVTKLSSYEQQLNDLTEENRRLSCQIKEIESLKEENSRLKSDNSDVNKSFENYKNETSQQLATQRNTIEEQKKTIQQGEEAIRMHISRFNQANSELMMLRQQYMEQDKFVKYQQHQISMKMEENSSIVKENNTLKEENSKFTKQIQDLLETIKSLELTVSNLTNSNKQVQEKLQKTESESQATIQQLEEQLKQRPVVAFPVKFEEDIINDAMDQKRAKDIVELIQVLNFFNISHPDSFERRSMFLSDQMAMSQSGKEVSILTHGDFAALDSLARSLFGQQQTIDHVEASVLDGVQKLEKILDRCDKEYILGLSYKVIAQQLRELASSHIYLYGKTLYPYISSSFDSNPLSSNNAMFNAQGYNIKMDDSSMSSTTKLKSNFMNSEITTSTTSTTSPSTNFDTSSNINITLDVPISVTTSPSNTEVSKSSNWENEASLLTVPSAPTEQEIGQLSASPANPNVVEGDVADSNSNIEPPNVPLESQVRLSPSAPSPTGEIEEAVTPATNPNTKKTTNYSRGRGRGSYGSRGRQRKLFVRTETKQ
ncbi:hypothetical protein C9374_001187 [Naegleria lovaniensis]|uniref:Uncharacterized protein n=1 Tax=Naegleria lovaniensis TaxID=51637 RepID=A0AA88KMH7_NAELO|nr:uncharacterized protein C9374_001187 [Naegleria lovaniensis]KAG2387593.1 hypothetical protein C9374_001187 [Naegleria lovaniensis]